VVLAKPAAAENTQHRKSTWENKMMGRKRRRRDGML
jgi:hypothetical protein